MHTSKMAFPLIAALLLGCAAAMQTGPGDPTSPAITAQDLRDLESEYGRLNIETSRSVLAFYQSRKNGAAAEPGETQPMAHAAT